MNMAMTIKTNADMLGKIKAVLGKKLNMVASSSNGFKTLTIFGLSEAENDNIVDIIVNQLNLKPVKAE